MEKGGRASPLKSANPLISTGNTLVLEFKVFAVTGFLVGSMEGNGKAPDIPGQPENVRKKYPEPKNGDL